MGNQLRYDVVDFKIDEENFNLLITIKSDFKKDEFDEQIPETFIYPIDLVENDAWRDQLETILVQRQKSVEKLKSLGLETKQKRKEFCVQQKSNGINKVIDLDVRETMIVVQRQNLVDLKRENGNSK